MGKKRSNKKKKWSLVENVSKNSNGEKNTDPAFNSNLKGENNKAQSKLSHESQNIKTLSCKSSLEKTNKPDISAAIPNAGANKSSKKCKPSSVKPSGVNSLYHLHKVKPVTLDPFEKKNPAEEKYSSVQSKPKNLRKAPELLVKDFNDKSYLTDFLGDDCCGSDKGASCDSEEKQYEYSTRKYSSVPSKSKNQRKAPELLVKDFNDKSYLTDFLGDDCCQSDKGAACESEEKQYDFSTRKYSSVPSKSKNQRKAPELMVKDFNDKSYLTDYLGNDCYESDKDAACDFFKPVFDNYQNSTNSKNKNLRVIQHGIYVEESYFDDHTLSSQARSSTANRFDKDDLEVSESRLELWSSLPSYSPVNSSGETGDFDNKIELKENISCRVDAYENSKETFAEVYRTWLPGRRGTLEKLKALLSEVHGDQLNFNKLQVASREVGLVARCAKRADSQVVSFLGSFTAFLTDAACGVVSTAQAFNIDSYQSKFKEIMEEDAKITKRLYKERSNCVVEYQNIEEVMRKFHPDSFSTTVSKISDSLEINKYWKAMKEAYGKDDMPQLLNIVSKFLDNAFQPTKLEEVKDSVFSYVNDNPKALEACKSATQATYGYLDTWTLNQSRLPALKGVSTAANLYLIQEDRFEIDRLNNAISEDLPQSKLESQIEDAIDSLELEMKEINHTYYELFKIYVDSNGSEWEISEMY